MERIFVEFGLLGINWFLCEMGFEGHELGFWSTGLIGVGYEARTLRFKDGVVYEKFDEYHWTLF